MEYTVKVDENGNVIYYKPGTNIRHRLDGPAAVYYDGHEEWYIDGKIHRDDGPAYVEKSGYKAWYKEGLRHREDGPAVVSQSGPEAWYKEGMLHREDGPALVFSDGREEWWIDGKQFSREEFENRTKQDKVRTFTVPVDTKEIRIQLE